jgi:hypothetical protein
MLLARVGGSGYTADVRHWLVLDGGVLQHPVSFHAASRPDGLARRVRRRYGPRKTGSS